ncbi:MAG: protein phosphatase 2C domain-containing protein [Sandaracinaceae bacterium]|nr:protein phosphatase 2C domain-containing protein [Sandaracinaceae bacterium]
MSEVVRARAALRVVGAGDTHIGSREHNEDSILLRPDLDLYMVADGAGGHNAGNIASALATTTVAHYFESTQEEALTAPPYDEMGLSWAARRLASAFQQANREVIEVAQSSDRRKGMGTTLVAAAFDLPRAPPSCSGTSATAAATACARAASSCSRRITPCSTTSSS